MNQFAQGNTIKLPTVTISIALYNAKDYIIRCLDSVAKQTYAGSIECIIVDDCGTDGSVKIVESYIRSYHGRVSFEIVHHEKNRGLSEARNTGINNAKGDYIFFLDNDDTIVPECIELMVQRVLEYPKSQMVFAGASTNMKGYEWMDFTKKQLPKYSFDRDWLQTSMLRRFDFTMTTWNKLISLKFIRDNSLRFKSGISHDDEFWNFQLAKYIEYASFIDKNTYYYQQYEGGIIQSESYSQGWDRCIHLWYHILNNLCAYNVTNQARGLCTFIFEYKKGGYPKRLNRDIFRLLFRAGLKMSYPYNIYTISQSFLALLNSKKYHNRKLRRRISLDLSVI